MSSVWFSEQSAPWFAYFSLFSLFGILGYYSKLGRYRRAVTGALAGGAAVGAIMGQPRYVVHSLGIPGAVMCMVFVAALAGLLREYRAAEMRRIAAREIGPWTMPGGS